MAVAQRRKRSGALLFLDLDQFKYINDTLGHQAGDSLLKMVGEALAQMTRKTDVVGRLGGDEFGMIMDEADAAEAMEGAKRVIQQVGNVEFPILGRVYKVSTSVGIALFPQHSADAQDLLAAADVAMYQAKDSGRGNWHLFSEQDQGRERMRQWVYWKEQIERALVEDRLILYFQPILNIQNNLIGHYEVLLRMCGEDGGIILPGHFIETAERTGLIHAIDRMVLAKAMRYLAMLRDRGRDLTFTVNLSGCAFEDPELLPRIEQLLQETRLDPAKLILEITETAAIADLMGARNLMLSIKQLGCRFALDDFGTGFSSFYYLKEIPADFVKIDGSFVRQLAENREHQVLVKALSEVAQNFGRRVIAEQVENAETLALLRQYRVDYAQGYFIGKPGPATTLFDTHPAPTDLLLASRGLVRSTL
jgi:diguanylate cyclase (GGDEF)-like protein